MSLIPGSRIGGYEIVGPLGAGGMGEAAVGAPLIFPVNATHGAVEFPALA